MKTEETPQELVTRLQDLAAHWTRECKTAEGLLDLVVKEQLLNMLPEDGGGGRARTLHRSLKGSI